MGGKGGGKCMSKNIPSIAEFEMTQHIVVVGYYFSLNAVHFHGIFEFIGKNYLKHHMVVIYVSVISNYHLIFSAGYFYFFTFFKGNFFFLFFFKFTNRFFVILRERWIFVFRYLVVHIFLAKHFAHTFSLFRKKKFWRAFFLNNLGAGMFFLFCFWSTRLFLWSM